MYKRYIKERKKKERKKERKEGRTEGRKKERKTKRKRERQKYIVQSSGLGSPTSQQRILTDRTSAELRDLTLYNLLFSCGLSSTK